MTLADQYAKALFETARRAPDQSAAQLKNLRQALARRGHEKLLPRIFAAYQALEAAEERRARLAAAVPGMQRTRTLVELYRKLIRS